MQWKGSRQFERPLHSTMDKVDYPQLKGKQFHWLVTGAAGFIGSNLLEALLKLDQKVTGLDNFATGHQRNLDEVQSLVSPSQWSNFDFIRGDIRDLNDCHRACKDVNFVLHEAALGSVPRSIDNPIASHETNISGFLNMLVAARDAKVQSFVYAASSSTYGDHPDLPKVEQNIGRPLSPYAVTKFVNELYGEVFARIYGFRTIGLRYFNVFGQRQDPDGAYAAVIPKWFAALLKSETVFINGDGETSRDFCYVENVIQANIRAALNQDSAATDQVYNVAFGQSTTLNMLFELIAERLQKMGVGVNGARPQYRDFRSGDVRHSLADIGKAQQLLGYDPRFSVRDGLDRAAAWYVSKA